MANDKDDDVIDAEIPPHEQDIVTQNANIIRFDTPDRSDCLVIERNVGQASFNQSPESFLLVSRLNEDGWYMSREDAEQLFNWLGTATT